MKRTYLITVDNDDYHQGEDFTGANVKAAIEGIDCSTECETRSFKVLDIHRIVDEDDPL